MVFFFIFIFRNTLIVVYLNLKQELFSKEKLILKKSKEKSNNWQKIVVNRVKDVIKIKLDKYNIRNLTIKKIW